MAADYMGILGLRVHQDDSTVLDSWYLARTLQRLCTAPRSKPFIGYHFRTLV